MSKQAKDYFIIGPALRPDNGVLEAVYSLLYLPANYKLMLPAAAPANRDFRQKVMGAIEQNALRGRVYVMEHGSVLDSPEAFASATLTMGRIAH